MTSFFQKCRQMLEMVRFEHTLFALPFALIGMILASRETKGGFTAEMLGWILVAMVGARSAAMSFNRLADASLDAKNPRTKMRHIPSGILTKSQVLSFMLVSILLFELSAWQLNLLCFLLSPIALVAILGYSYTKRFTSYCHLFLGFATGLAPIGAWIAVKASLSLIPLLLGLVVLFWIGGFDIIYALQDYDHDLNVDTMHSLPKRFGKRNALIISRVMHACMISLLIAIGILLHLHFLYFLGIAIVSALIIWEQSLVKPNDISRVNLAFFTLNGWVSITLLLFVIIDGMKT